MRSCGLARSSSPTWRLRRFAADWPRALVVPQDHADAALSHYFRFANALLMKEDDGLVAVQAGLPRDRVRQRGRARRLGRAVPPVHVDDAARPASRCTAGQRLDPSPR